MSFGPENSWIVETRHEHQSSSQLHCDWGLVYSVITDEEMTPASPPNPFACLWYDTHLQGTVPPNRLHCSLLDCEMTIDIIHSQLKPAHMCLSPFGFCWVLLQVLLCVKQNTATVTLSYHLSKHRCQQQTPSATLTTSLRLCSLCLAYETWI